MIRFAFVAVFAFAGGVLVRDQAEDFWKAEAKPSCQRAVENAERFGAALVAVLNGGAFETEDVRVSCRVVPIRKEML